MEKYRFFDAVEDENGVYDREYNAQEFTDYFKALVTTGIMKGAGSELKVTTNGSSMVTTIDTGIAFLLGRYYENDSPLELTHDTEVLSKSRIDRIVIRMNLNTEARYVKAFIKKGVASTSPVAPTLTQTNDVYEISLAQVKIVGGQTYIGVNDITDERGKDVICPWAGSNILPNFSDSSIGQPGGLAQLNEFGKVINADGKEASGIEENGSNANGEYVKFSDGTLICYNPKFRVNYKNSQTLETFWTYPHEFLFNSTPAVTASIDYWQSSVNATDNIGYPIIKEQKSLTVYVGVYSFEGGFVSTDYIYMSVMAIGRWK